MSISSKPSPKSRSKPKIRILRHLARTGGTLITKCIGSMDKVVVLSEIHPANLAVTNPMGQALDWFNLIDKKQIARWQRMKGPTMLQFVASCETRASARNESLVLRDWSHLDYYGLPYTQPTMHTANGTGLRDSLANAYDILEACTTRHPIDQYLSLSKLPIMNPMNWDLFLDGNLAFAEYCVAQDEDPDSSQRFVRYEDLTRNPDAQLKVICNKLDLNFDPSYAQRWSAYTTITGDVARGGSEGTKVQQIRPLERKPIDNELLTRFRDDDRYQQTCELLGYDP